MNRTLALALSLLGGSLVAFAACGGTSPAGYDRNAGTDGGAEAGDLLPVDPFGDNGPTGERGCVNLECRQVECGENAGSTNISGRVLDPSGQLPLYNVIVYVPNTEPKPFADTISCERCGSVTSGSPVTTAITGPDGKFVLPNVPAGADVPLVIQIGKWRRQLVLPKVEECAHTPVADLRMPKTQSEGDMPRIAIATGSIDPFQCLLRKIGIVDAEFTAPSASGRIHLYQENGMGLGADAPASQLYGDAERLKKYDMVILPCGANDLNKGTPDKQRIMDYTAQGGRVFTTHYGYDWLRDAPAPWPSTARYRQSEGSFLGTPTGIIDTSFPKGADFAEWLVLATRAVTPGANPVKGQFAINEPRQNVDAVAGETRQWVTTSSPASVQHFTFNTPVGKPVDEQCGRVVYSNFHVTSGTNSTSDRFPAKCASLSQALSPQELALVFMLFDLSSCIQKDDERPTPPPVK